MVGVIRFSSDSANFTRCWGTSRSRFLKFATMLVAICLSLTSASMKNYCGMSLIGSDCVSLEIDRFTIFCVLGSSLQQLSPQNELFNKLLNCLMFIVSPSHQNLGFFCLETLGILGMFTRAGNFASGTGIGKST